MKSLELIESMHGLSVSMVAAAQANDWDELVRLEHDMARLRGELARLEPNGRQAEDLSDAEQQHKAALIAAILDYEQEIRRHVDPWLASTRKLLAGSTRANAMRNAYGALAP